MGSNLTYEYTSKSSIYLRLEGGLLIIDVVELYDHVTVGDEGRVAGRGGHDGQLVVVEGLAVQPRHYVDVARARDAEARRVVVAGQLATDQGQGHRLPALHQNLQAGRHQA